jgi:hypothetical protein
MNVARLLSETGRDSDLLRVLIYPIQPERLSLKAASPLMMRLWGPGIQAMTVKNWIFVDPKHLKGDRDRLARLVIHELVHVRQWNDFGVIGFLSRYVTDYFRGRRQGLTHREAYMNIGLEEEARQVQTRVIS